MDGKFVTIEGLDGCGKGTVVESLKELFAQNDNVVFLREPGGSKIGETIRSVILDPQNKGMMPTCEYLLFSASRAQMVETILKPLLKSGKTVICERFADSSIAYQGYGRGLDVEKIVDINNFATGGLVPDLTLYLKADAKTTFARSTGRGELDRIELDGVTFQEKVMYGYERLASRFADRYAVIDALKSREEVYLQVKDALKRAKIVND